MNKHEMQCIGREVDHNFEELTVTEGSGDSGPVVKFEIFRCFWMWEQEQSGPMSDYQDFYIDEIYEAAENTYPDDESELFA